MIINEKVKVTHPLGLHMRAGAGLVSITHQFKCAVVFKNGSKQASAKSLLNLMALGAVKGVELEVQVEGDDAGEALTAIREFFQNQFNEKTPKTEASWDSLNIHL